MQISSSRKIFCPVVLASTDNSHHLQFESSLLPIYFGLFSKFWIPVTISHFSPNSRPPGNGLHPYPHLALDLYYFVLFQNQLMSPALLSLLNFPPVSLPTTQVSTVSFKGGGDLGINTGLKGLISIWACHLLYQHCMLLRGMVRAPSRAKVENTTVDFVMDECQEKQRKCSVWFLLLEVISCLTN